MTHIYKLAAVMVGCMFKLASVYSLQLEDRPLKTVMQLLPAYCTDTIIKNTNKCIKLRIVYAKS